MALLNIYHYSYNVVDEKVSNRGSQTEGLNSGGGAIDKLASLIENVSD
jgi:hypothetical protein